MRITSVFTPWLLSSLLLIGAHGAYAVPAVAGVETGHKGDASIASALTATQDGVCLPGPESTECADTAGQPLDKAQFPFWEDRGFVQLQDRGTESAASKTQTAPRVGRKSAVPAHRVSVYFFWGDGCPHCADEKPFLESLQKRFPGMEIKSYEVWRNKQNAGLMANLVRAYEVSQGGVPMTFVGNRSFVGFSKQTGIAIAAAVSQCLAEPCSDPLDILEHAGLKKTDGLLSSGATTLNPSVQTPGAAAVEKTIDLPFFGSMDATALSLPMLTLMIAGMDSFNPCAFFVLLSLLGLMIHARSRGRMLLVGGIFVFFSGFIYFLFMAAWLNLFLIMGQVAIITRIAGVLTLVIAVINIKDFFLFKKGVSLTIPDSAKPKLFERMRGLIHASSFPSLLAGTTLLAIVANSYELLCTAGFPMAYTRILTLSKLSSLSYYLYLALYNVIYVVPLLIIVVIFAVTLGKRQLTEFQGRFLKLVSGAMMLGLALALLINPALLNNVLFSFLLLAGAVGLSLLVAFAMKER